MYRYLLIIIFLASWVGMSQAQDLPENITTMYYEEHQPDRLVGVLFQENLCLERIMQLNPTLDITDVSYGTEIVIPLDEPCYDIPDGTYWKHDVPRLKYYENGEWLDEPYYSSAIQYIHITKSTEDVARAVDSCPDDLLRDNILLQDLEIYLQFSYGFTFDVFIPQGEPTCAPPSAFPSNSQVIYVLGTKFTPKYFSETYNVCAEEYFPTFDMFYLPMDIRPHTYDFDFPLDTPACYNEDGQRLTYYDESGVRLDEPVYSDLPVYITGEDETIEAIAQELDVCAVDLVQVNGFPNIPILADMELFVPPQRECPDDLQWVSVPLTTNPALDLNICPSILAELNPFYNKEHTTQTLRSNGGRGSTSSAQAMILPVEYDPCYASYETQAGQYLMDIERELNVCREEFLLKQGYFSLMASFKFTQSVTIQVPIDTQPCYNEEGQRLYYPPNRNSYFDNVPDDPPYYPDMTYYEFKAGDTLYSISREFNVCVHDIQLANKHQLVPDFYIYIPNTPPCYDGETGNSLIYEDETGHPLDEPQVAEHVMYYGEYFHIDRFFNVCVNRIEDANRAKLNQEDSYLGWIIPTDRPPCYDANRQVIEYVCYTEPIDISADYRNLDKEIIFHEDGSDCYDLSNPETIIWYENQPYRAIYYKDTLFQSRAFTAWCYGVPLDEIEAINAEEDVLNLLPLYTRLIPEPTRDCYLDTPNSLNGQIVHRVYPDETVSSIAEIYDVPYQLIAIANNLDEDYTIWVGQDLIIPTLVTWRNLTVFAGGLMSVILLFVLSFRRKHRQTSKKKKRTTD